MDTQHYTPPPNGQEELMCAYKAGIINEDSALNINSYGLYTDYGPFKS